MRKSIFSGSLAALLLTFSSLSHAGLVTTNTQPVTEDFSAYTGGWTFTGGPVTLTSGAIWSTSNTGSVIGDSGYGLGSNGSWSGKTSTGLNTGTGFMEFIFPSLTSYAGGFINYSPGTGPNVLIEVFDAAFNLLESYDLTTLAPISTPGGFNAGAFRGISRASADIHALRVSNQYVMLDDLTFDVAVVPAPQALALFGLGLIGLSLARKKK